MPLVRPRELPYRLPARGGRARLALVGPRARLQASAPRDAHPALRTRLFELAPGSDEHALRAALEAFAPHALIAFGPQAMAPALFADLPAPVVGYLVDAPPGGDGRRARAARRAWIEELQVIDPAAFDRLVAVDPVVEPIADEAGLALWRSLPMPVADHVYGAPRRIRGRPRVLLAGRVTRDREEHVGALRERFAVSFATPDTDLAAHDVCLSLDDDTGPFAGEVGRHLAAGLLVVCPPLPAILGLEPGLDHLEAQAPWELVAYVLALADYPGAHDAVCLRGRRKAEAFRASAVYPRLLADLWADLAARGSARAQAAARRGEPQSATSASASRTSAG